jgi:RNA polymerase sigma-70 factor (ECF subfamily)
MSTLVGGRPFEAATATFRRELHVHAYRMLANFDEAEDAVQEAYLRAWRGWDSFDGQNARAWLYRIVTNVCTDIIRARGRQVRQLHSFAEVGWLTPYPDRLLDEIPSSEAEPEAVSVERETIELAFLAALQVLPPRQRAALLAREVLGMTAAETADLLEVSVASANSALQRARTTMRGYLPRRRVDWSPPAPDAAERALLDRFIDAHQRYDVAATLAVASTDIRVTMPPAPMCFEGRDELVPLLQRAFGPDREGDWRLVPTAVNRLPAAASYLRRFGDTEFRGFKLDVLQIEDGAIAEITTFGYSTFAGLGLPLVLHATS